MKKSTSKQERNDNMKRKAKITRKSAEKMKTEKNKENKETEKKGVKIQKTRENAEKIKK